MTGVSYQLYSSRNFGPLPATLSMLSQLGYTAVEGYGGLFQDQSSIDHLKSALGDSGLKMPTAHVGLDTVQGDAGQLIADAKALAIEAIFVPHTNDQDRTPEEWSAFGAALAEAGKPLQDAGLAFGWHNHNFEFSDLGTDRRPLEYMLEASDELAFEFDIAWAVVAGEDPLDWIDRFGDRLIAVHVKDRAPDGIAEDEDGWADVGHGTIDWSLLVPRLRERGVQHFVMEHDNPNDDVRFATRSIAAFHTFGDGASS